MGIGYRLFGGRTRAQEKRSRERKEDDAREVARETAYERDHRCCRKCGKPLVLKPADAQSAWQIAHAHEILSRALGGDPTDSRNIVTLCLLCHLLGLHKQTAKEADWFVIAILDSEFGADAPEGIAFRPYRGSKWQSMFSAD